MIEKSTNNRVQLNIFLKIFEWHIMIGHNKGGILQGCILGDTAHNIPST